MQLLSLYISMNTIHEFQQNKMEMVTSYGSITKMQKLTLTSEMTTLSVNE